MAVSEAGSGCEVMPRNEAGLPAVVAALLEAGADINAQDCEGATALGIARELPSYLRKEHGWAAELVALLEAAAAAGTGGP